jgi:hypothetical protein
VHRRLAARLQAGQEVVEARRLVAPGLLEPEPRGRVLLGQRGLLPALRQVDEEGRVEGGVVRLEELFEDPGPVPGDRPQPGLEGSPTTDRHWRGGQSWVMVSYARTS